MNTFENVHLKYTARAGPPFRFLKKYATDPYNLYVGPQCILALLEIGPYICMIYRF